VPTGSIDLKDTKAPTESEAVESTLPSPPAEASGSLCAANQEVIPAKLEQGLAFRRIEVEPSPEMQIDYGTEARCRGSCTARICFAWCLATRARAIARRCGG
jgi:hypothetical protein